VPSPKPPSLGVFLCGVSLFGAGAARQTAPLRNYLGRTFSNSALVIFERPLIPLRRASLRSWS
jgi:hypothetical protein